MPDGSPAGGFPGGGSPGGGSPGGDSPGGGSPAADQPTTDLNQLWQRPAATADPSAEVPDPKDNAATIQLTGRASEAEAADDLARASREHDLTGFAPTEQADRAGFRLAAFGALLIVVLFAGYGLGRLNSGAASASAPPTTTTPTTGGVMPGMAMDESQPHTHGTTSAQSGSGGAAPGGLSLSENGLTLVPGRTTFTAGQKRRLEFRISGPGGAPVTTYAIVHDKPLHLVIVRRDLSGFQHLHPSMAADGTWGIDLTLAQPGIYRMITDFTAVVGGRPVVTTLGSDLTVPGDYAPVALPAPAHAVATGGFAVAYEGAASTQSTQPILISVAGSDHQPAVLEPYLGAYGHLVVLREGDLAYVHVHPEAQLVDGKVKFWLSVPSGGAYRMFFDFQVASQVHTAAWTAEV